jgi:hypothetical protein
VKKNGFPNCFGYQRFGKGYKNFWEAKEVISSVENPLSLPMDSVVTRTGWNQAPL